MAARKKTQVPPLDIAKLGEIFAKLVEFGATEDSPVTVGEMNDEMAENTFDNLNILADAELIGMGEGTNAGKLWVAIPDVSSENAGEFFNEAFANMSADVLMALGKPAEAPKKLTAKELEYKERTEYNARVAESQDGVMSQSPEFTEYRQAVKDEAPETPDWVADEMATRAVKPAETPVIAADGTAVTVPVDPENDPKGPRRELDASKGEKLLSEDVIKVKATTKPERLPEIDGLDQFIDDETGAMVYESRIAKVGLWLDEPESVPALPEGVNPNTWNAAHTAATQTARDWYLARVKTQQEEHKINEGAPAPF
jgi:hypothetical protein